MAPPVLTLRDLNRATLARQGLLEPLPSGEPVATSVERLGALQAQHPDWPAFALRSRLPPNADVDVGAARERREVVRASLMRITVHLVSTSDFWPMSALTLRYRREQFRAIYKLDPATSPLGRRLVAAQPIVLEAMRREPLAIHQIEMLLATEIGPRIAVPPNRALWRHFSGSVPLIHAPHPSEAYGRSRYVAAADWLSDPPRIGEAEAARHVAERYLAAFGPASAQDFSAFVARGKGLPILRGGIAALGDRVVTFRDEEGRELVDLREAPRPPAATPAPPRLLARWDSLLLAYGTRDRARVLADEHRSTVVTRNADVLPTFLVDGFVAGTWLPRRDSGGRPHADLRPFGRLRAGDREALEAEAARLLPDLADGAYARYPGTN